MPGIWFFLVFLDSGKYKRKTHNLKIRKNLGSTLLTKFNSCWIFELYLESSLSDFRDKWIYGERRWWYWVSISVNFDWDEEFRLSRDFEFEFKGFCMFSLINIPAAEYSSAFDDLEFRATFVYNSEILIWW